MKIATLLPLLCAGCVGQRPSSPPDPGPAEGPRPALSGPALSGPAQGPPSPPAAVGARAPGPDRLAEAVRAGDYPRLTSVVVLREGETVYEGYFNGADAETLHDTRSSMKSLTALAVGVAIGEGKIASTDTPAFAFLRDLRPFAHNDKLKASITVGDLLTMSSALECDDNVEQSAGNEENMYPQKAWARWAVDLPVRPAYARDASGRGPFAYCTAGVFLLGQIVQRATGRPVDRYVEDSLLRPLGIDRFEWPRSPSGEVMTGGGLRLRSRDLAKVGQMVFDGGRFGGRQIVPERWVAEALTVHRRPTPEQDYGYLFWRRDYATPCGRSSGWYMSGNGGNVVVILRDLRAVAVVTSVNYNTRGMHQQTIRLLEEQIWPMLPCP